MPTDTGDALVNSYSSRSLDYEKILLSRADGFHFW